MKNLEIARIFYEMADILEMQGVEWKPRAYRRAAKAIESLTEDIEVLWHRGGLKTLEEIPGVGERLAKKIEEFLKTGKIKEYEQLKRMVPFQLHEIMSIPGMGPKKAKRLYKELGVKTIKDLEKAVKEHKIAALPGFGEKSEKDILRGIQLYKASKGRMLLGRAWFIANEIIEKLSVLKEVKKISPAGSLRRMKETIGDIDILVISTNPMKVMNFFTSMPDVKEILAKGPTKSTVILRSGIQADVRVLKPESWGSALQYFTGSKEHNIALRRIAIKKGYKLNEYGLFKGKKQIAGKTEEEIYRKLGLQWIPPELRENRGEIEAAQKKALPKLVDYKDIKGDFHVHTKWSDGDNTIKEMALAAKQLGYEYICISDHSKSEPLAHGLDEKKLLEQIKEIRKIDRQLKGIKILAGNEVDILADGSLDLSDSVLKKLDIVIASVHSGFKMPKQKMTKRIIKAIENKYVDILGHPTGRIINERPPYAVDLEAIFQVAKDRRVHMEINSFPDRLDLNDTAIMEAKKYGLRFAINTDAHNADQLKLIKFGVATARRGWAEKKDIINTYSLKQLGRFFRKLKNRIGE